MRHPDGMKQQLSLVSLAILALLFSACPGNEAKDSSKSGPSKASTSTQNTQAVPENSTAMNPVIAPHAGAEAPATVDVQLTEYMIDIPETMKPGPTTLRIVNGGKEAHGFVIEGNGFHGALPDSLQRGDGASIDVTLRPGTYQVWCPVDGHKGKGMARTITVR